MLQTINYTKQNLIKIFVISAAFFITSAFHPKGSAAIKYSKSFSTQVSESSDVVIDASGQHIYMVSDNGLLFETNSEGKIIRESDIRGIDFEGICMADQLLYISDESARKVYSVNPENLKIVKTFNLNYNAGRNRGFESIAYNASLKQFYLISEKEEIVVRVYNEQFEQLNELSFKASADISSACFHNNHLWLLSDEDHKLMMLDDNFQVSREFTMNVHNPEGFFFDALGNLMVLSDDMAKLYQFEAALIQ